MPTVTSLEEAVKDIFALFDTYFTHDVSRIVVYGSALENIEEAADIDLIVISPIGESAEAELAFYLTMDQVWPTGRFGQYDIIVLTKGDYQTIHDDPELDGDDTWSTHVIEAVREGREFRREDYRPTKQSFVRSLLSALPV